MTGNSILDELSYDRPSGALTYKGVRYLLIRPETITGFQRKVERISEKDAGESLFSGGFAGGSLSTRKYKEAFGLSDREAIEFMLKMGSEIGWGGFRLDEYDPEADVLRVSVANSPFAESYGKSNRGVCHLIRGIVGGIGSVLFGQACTALEISCAAMGDEKCVFEVRIL